MKRHAFCCSLGRSAKCRPVSEGPGGAHIAGRSDVDLDDDGGASGGAERVRRLAHDDRNRQVRRSQDHRVRRTARSNVEQDRWSKKAPDQHVRSLPHAVLGGRLERPAGDGLLQRVGQRRAPAQASHPGHRPGGVDTDFEGRLTLTAQRWHGHGHRALDQAGGLEAAGPEQRGDHDPGEADSHPFTLLTLGGARSGPVGRRRRARQPPVQVLRIPTEGGISPRGRLDRLRVQSLASSAAECLASLNFSIR